MARVITYMLIWGLALYVGACDGGTDAPPSAPSGPPAPASLITPQADQTALIVVQLTPDEAMEITTVSPRTIPWRRPSLATDSVAGRGLTLLAVSHPSRLAPFLVGLDLGRPGEAAGDISDRWEDGAVIVRAPYFGEGTTYRFVRHGRVTPAPSLSTTTPGTDRGHEVTR